MLIKKNFEQILEFKNYANWRTSNGFNTKLDYAINKVLKRLNKECLDAFNIALSDIEVDYASVDKDGNLIKTNNTYSYKPEKEKEMRHKKLELIKEWEGKEFEFENYIATEVGELNDEEKDILKDFVI